MGNSPDNQIMLAEHVFEVRYMASGSFLDVRGYVADYIRDSKFLPHWKIDSNTVNFRDHPQKVESEGAFAAYNKAGYVTYNPKTRNFFMDRGGSFWRILEKNKHYKIPPLERFGARTKVFLPSDKSFDSINKTAFNVLYTEKAREIFGGTETDVQFIVELNEAGFQVRILGGPIHKEEAGNYLGFQADEFQKAGFFLDLDFYKTKDFQNKDIPYLLKKAVELTWTKVENIAGAIGL